MLLLQLRKLLLVPEASSQAVLLNGSMYICISKRKKQMKTYISINNVQSIIATKLENRPQAFCNLVTVFGAYN